MEVAITWTALVTVTDAPESISACVFAVDVTSASVPAPPPLIRPTATIADVAVAVLVEVACMTRLSPLSTSALSSTVASPPTLAVGRLIPPLMAPMLAASVVAFAVLCEVAVREICPPESIEPVPTIALTEPPEVTSASMTEPCTVNAPSPTECVLPSASLVPIAVSATSPE